MTTPTNTIPKWPGIRVGILSLFDLNGAWTIQQIRNLMPPPKQGGSFNEILLRGSISTSSVKTYSSLPE